MSMLEDFQGLPGIGDQIDYLINACQVKWKYEKVNQKSYYFTVHSCKWKKDITEKLNLSLRREVWLHHSHVDWLITRLVKSVNIENIITSVWCMDGILSARQAG